MARRRKSISMEEEKESMAEVPEVSVSHADAIAPKKKVKKISFRRWAISKGYKEHHLAGLRAFVPNVNVLKSAEEWDRLFDGY